MGYSSSDSDSSSDSEASSDSSNSERELDNIADEKQNQYSVKGRQKGDKKIGQESAIAKAKVKQNTNLSKGGEKQKVEKKGENKEEKSVRVLKRVITKHKQAQQKLNKKLNFALKQVRLEGKKQKAELKKINKH